MYGICDVVLKNCRDVFLRSTLVSDAERERERERLHQEMRCHAYLWEVPLAVADEQAGFAAPAVADNDNLF